MNMLGLISNVQWIPVIAMTIFSFALGMLWHSRFMFGKTWSAENNPNNLKVKLNAPLIFGGTAFMHFLALAGLSLIVSEMGWKYGLSCGLIISIVWIVPAMSGTYLFANRSLKLLAIDAGMYIILFSVTGLILGIW